MRFFPVIFFLSIFSICLSASSVVFAQPPSIRLRKKDLRKDIEMITTEGTVRLRLSDLTPLHRDNFLRLSKAGFYDGILFHRVIKNFMIQAGDPKTRPENPVKNKYSPDSAYTIPSEFRPELFHKRGVLAAARMGDDVNPQKASSGTQFYIVHGRIFSDVSLDSTETFRLKGRKLPENHRRVYTSAGGAPHLDQNYTVFGEVLQGMDVVDRIAETPTTGRQGGDKPTKDIRIREIRLVKRKSPSH
jgi:peptidyl-prolyl cis-trans isomerase B (cyclophilin B)